MKRIKIWNILLLAIMMMLLVVSCGKSESDFDEELGRGYILIAKTMYGNSIVYDEISHAWYEGIHKDITPSGKHCRDFDEALKEIVDTLDAYNVRKETKQYNDSLLEIASQLNSPPSGRKECYDDFVDIVSDVSTLNRSALDPSGSYNDYTQRNKALFDSIAKKLDKFRIKYGSILPKKAEGDGIDD